MKTQEITKKQIDKIIKAIIEKPNKKKFGMDITFHSCELHKTSNKTVQVTNGKVAIVIEGIYDSYYHNDKYSDVVINHFTRQCESVVFPRVESVIPEYYSNPHYSSYLVTIPKFKSKKSIIYVIRKDEGVEFIEKDNHDPQIVDYFSKVSSISLYPFSGFKLNLFFHNTKQTENIVLESDSNQGISFRYVSVSLK